MAPEATRPLPSRAEGSLMEFLLLLLALGVVTLVGHGVWVVLAALLRAVSGGEREEPSRPLAVPPVRRCDGCGTRLSLQQVRCPACGRAAVAAEADELEVASRHVRALAERGPLDRATAEGVLSLLDARRRELLGAPVPSRAGELEKLLAGAAKPGDLSADERRQALEWFRKLDDRDRAGLSAPAQLLMARLLRVAGLTSRSLTAYSERLDAHPKAEDRAAVALEAARFAQREGLAHLAGSFLDRALAGAPTAEERADAEALLRQLAAVPDVEEALEALPADPPTVELVVEAASPAVVERPAPAPLRVPAPPAPPRRRLGSLLGAFMEEKNILWGELVGGLLIVGCSIALVITLWNSLSELPYFPFLIFSAITAALLGAGQYTLHHWNVASTKRG